MAERGFVLKDISYKSFASPGDEAVFNNKDFSDYFNEKGPGPFWSYALCRSGTNQNTLINPTGIPGYVMNIYYSLMFELPKDNWWVFKRDEVIDVTPVHHQYYQITHVQKEALETRIREGMVKISQSVADLELVQHDLIKYEDFEKKFKDKKSNPDEKGITPKEKKEREEKKKSAEMELKTTFVDEVDFHAGGGAQGAGRLSMAFMRNNNIMPTIVDDFFRMKNKEDLEKEPSLKNIPTVEKRMLEVKFDAYTDWLGYFESNVTRRMDALRTLQRSRENTLKEYRSWLKPIIAKYKMIVERLDSAGERKKLLTHSIRTAGVATAYNIIDLWFWKEFIPPDPHRVPQELIEKSGVRAIGKWEYENLYFHPDHGLIADYPWITRKWIEATAKLDNDGNVKGVSGVKESSWYYSFFTFTLDRTNIKTSATGTELEDGNFFITNYMMSKNVVVAKFLELKAYEEMLEVYIDDVLGMAHKIDGKPVIIYEKGEKEGYEIDKNHRKELARFNFKVDDEITITSKDYPAESAFKNWKALVAAFPDKKFALVERKKENKLTKTIKETLGLGNLRLFLPGGPYEQNFSERIKKIYLKPNSARFEYVANFLKAKMNIGGG